MSPKNVMTLMKFRLDFFFNISQHFRIYLVVFALKFLFMDMDRKEVT